MEAIMNLNLNPYLPIILPPLLTLCFSAAAALYHLSKTWIEARIPASILRIVEDVVTNVVHSIEAQYEGAAGADKKTAAVSEIAQILQSMHLTVSPALISSSIDYAVTRMNQIAALRTPAPAPAATVSQ